ncbi:DUF3455 domain-containing protein [Pseudomonas sp. X10]
MYDISLLGVRRALASFAGCSPLGYCALTLLMLAGSVRVAVANEAFPPVPGATELLSVQAHGVQIYECRVDDAGKLAWAFREPLATLILDGRTVGRHFAGPSWQMTDGTLVTGKVVAQAPGANEQDIAQLRLEIVTYQGALPAVREVQRLDTHGGQFAGSCQEEGALHLEPYSARYVFLGQ